MNDRADREGLGEPIANVKVRMARAKVCPECGRFPRWDAYNHLFIVGCLYACNTVNDATMVGAVKKWNQWAQLRRKEIVDA